jgi:hypothetical protein
MPNCMSIHMPVQRKRGRGYGGHVGHVGHTGHTGCVGGRGHPAPGLGSYTYSRPPRADLAYTTVTVPSMVLKSNMIVKPE